MKDNKLPYILEITWLVVSIIAAALAVHSTIVRGFRGSITAYLIFLIALLMYIMRRNLRKK